MKMPPTPVKQPHQASNLDRFLKGAKTPARKKPRRRKVADGVVFYEDLKSRPYCINKMIDKKTRRQFFFATLEEAVEELKAYKQAKIDAFSAKRRALAPKRAADLAKKGDNSALERRVSAAVVDAWKKQTGRDAMVLNDGTTGDILLQRKDGHYLVVQVKSTHEKRKGRNSYLFGHVCGYNDMPVFCFCESDAIGWIIDGTKLDQRGKEALEIRRPFARRSGRTSTRRRDGKREIVSARARWYWTRVVLDNAASATLAE